MVVIVHPSACTASTVHDFTDSPSRWTVQAPHDEVSHPTLVPVSPRASRRWWTSSVRGSTSCPTWFPLTVSEISIPLTPLFLSDRRLPWRPGGPS